MFLQIIIASSIGSLLALIGGIVLLWKEKWMKKASLFLVSFATGTLLGVAFLDLLPEALEGAKSEKEIFWAALLGIFALFIFEKIMREHHCHHEKCDEKTISASLLFGDTIHNFVDGVAIAAAFLFSVPAGIATTIAVFFHEVPQEIGDFGILLHLGYKKSTIVFLNIVTALSTFMGATLGYFFLSQVEGLIGYVLAFASGMFIYIATSDLIPEVRHKEKKGYMPHMITVFVGVGLIFALGILLPE